MASMDVFRGDAFNTFSLTQAINAVPYVPGWLGQLGIFEDVPVRTEFVAIEKRDNTLNLIQTTPRGAPPKARSDDKRDIRSFRTVRIANQDKLYATEIQNIRAFGSDSELEQVQAEVMRKMLALRRDQALTHENMRLGAVMGVVKDADGSTIIDWFSASGWNVSQPAEISFSFTTATAAAGTIRNQCAAVVRAMARASKGTWIDGQSYAVGLCDDAFFDALVGNAETRATYLNQQEAAELRNGTAFETFKYGGIIFVNYRGTDDNSTVAVTSNNAGKCKFFPVNAPGVFQRALSPGESFEWANTLGQPEYARTVLDDDYNEWVAIDVRSYPLYICTKPLMLQRGAAA